MVSEMCDYRRTASANLSPPSAFKCTDEYMQKRNNFKIFKQLKNKIHSFTYLEGSGGFSLLLCGPTWENVYKWMMPPFKRDFNKITLHKRSGKELSVHIYEET